MKNAKPIPTVIIALYWNDVKFGDKIINNICDGKMNNRGILRTYYSYNLFRLVPNFFETF